MTSTSASRRATTPAIAWGETKCACCGHALPKRPAPIKVVSAEFPGLPIAEMVARCWIFVGETADDLRASLFRFFDVDSVDELRTLLAGPLRGCA